MIAFKEYMLSTIKPYFCESFLLTIYTCPRYITYVVVYRPRPLLYSKLNLRSLEYTRRDQLSPTAQGDILIRLFQKEERQKHLRITITHGTLLEHQGLTQLAVVFRVLPVLDNSMLWLCEHVTLSLSSVNSTWIIPSRGEQFTPSKHIRNMRAPLQWHTQIIVWYEGVTPLIHFVLATQQNTASGVAVFGSSCGLFY